MIHELKGTELGTKAKEQLVIIWADIQPRSATDILKDISHFSVSSVKNGELTRVMIGMRGWTHRAAVLDVMEQLGAEVVYYTGGPPS